MVIDTAGNGEPESVVRTLALYLISERVTGDRTYMGWMRKQFLSDFLLCAHVLCFLYVRLFVAHTTLLTPIRGLY